MKKYILSTTLYFLSFISFSQSNYINGYIINKQKDTIYGLLRTNEVKSSAKKCVFKVSTDDEKQTYSPYDIAGYRFTDGKYYISKEVLLEGENKRVFLEYLIDGIVDMYFHRDVNGDHYWVENEEGQISELTNDEISVNIDGQSYVKNSKRYVGVLKIAFNKSSNAIRKSNTVALKHKSLIKIAENYHNEVCSDYECIVYEKKLPKKIHQYGVLAGAMFSRIDMSLRTSFKPSTIGVYYKVNLPYWSDRIWFAYECVYADLRYSNEQPTSVFNSDYLKKSIHHTAIIKYEPFKRNGNINIQTGLVFGHKIKHSRDSWRGLSEYYERHAANSFGILLGLGGVFKITKKREIFADMRYQRGLLFSLPLQGEGNEAPVLDGVSVNIGLQIF